MFEKHYVRKTRIGSTNGTSTNYFFRQNGDHKWARFITGVIVLAFCGCRQDRESAFQIEVSFADDLSEEELSGLSFGELSSVLSSSINQSGQVSGFSSTEKSNPFKVSKKYFSNRIPDYLLIGVLKDGKFLHWEIYDFCKVVDSDVWNSPLSLSTDPSVQLKLLVETDVVRISNEQMPNPATKIKIKELAKSK